MVPFAIGCSLGLGIITIFKNKPNRWNSFILPSLLSFWLLFCAFWQSTSLLHMIIFCGTMLITAFGGWAVKHWTEHKKPTFKKYHQALLAICFFIYILFGSASEKGWPSFIYMFGIGICAGMPWVPFFQYLSKHRTTLHRKTYNQYF